MSDVTWADVVAFMPSLSTIASLEQTSILLYVNTRALRPDMFGGDLSVDYFRARLYLAAHVALIEKLRAGGVVGPVTSESAGGVSRSYANLAASGSQSGWSQTGPGQLLLDMLVASRGPFVA